jgi:hypothetical protein
MWIMGEDARGRFRNLPPSLTLLVVAPLFGEFLSTATAPLDILLPWNLALFVGLYGCGALLCREVAHRYGLGWPGLLLLGAAFGVYVEGLVDRFWYDPGYWDKVGVGDYSVVWHVNVLMATHLTLFHAAVSVVGAIIVVERLFPTQRARAWIGPIGMGLCGVALAAVLFITWEEFYLPPAPVLLAAALLCALLVLAAFWAGGHWARSDARAAHTSGPGSARVGLIAFACTAVHFASVYAIPSTGLPWPIGVALTLIPVAIGVLLVRRRATGGLGGPDALRVVTGIVAFFLLLNLLAGLGGRYDMTLAALGVGFLLWRLQRRPAELRTSRRRVEDGE